MKHAFPDEEKGEIYINFSIEINKLYSLIVKDNGVPFKGEVSFEISNTLGLVSILTDGSNGKIFFNKKEKITKHTFMDTEIRTYNPITQENSFYAEE